MVMTIIMTKRSTNGGSSASASISISFDCCNKKIRGTYQMVTKSGGTLPGRPTAILGRTSTGLNVGGPGVLIDAGCGAISVRTTTPGPDNGPGPSLGIVLVPAPWYIVRAAPAPMLISEFMPVICLLRCSSSNPDPSLTFSFTCALPCVPPTSLFLVPTILLSSQPNVRAFFQFIPMDSQMASCDFWMTLSGGRMIRRINRDREFGVG